MSPELEKAQKAVWDCLTATSAADGYFIPAEPEDIIKEVENLLNLLREERSVSIKSKGKFTVIDETQEEFEKRLLKQQIIDETAELFHYLEKQLQDVNNLDKPTLLSKLKSLTALLEKE